MTRVVIDTNVLVSALLNEHGAEAAVLRFVGEGKLIWCVSEAVLKEYEEVLSRPRFRHIEPRYVAGLLGLARSGQMAAAATRLTLSKDDSDNRFYECGQAAGADYIVTGNRKDFPKDLLPTRIVNARQLLQRLDL